MVLRLNFSRYLYPVGKTTKQSLDKSTERWNFDQQRLHEPAAPKHKSKVYDVSPAKSNYVLHNSFNSNLIWRKWQWDANIINQVKPDTALIAMTCEGPVPQDETIFMRIFSLYQESSPVQKYLCNKTAISPYVIHPLLRLTVTDS